MPKHMLATCLVSDLHSCKPEVRILKFHANYFWLNRPCSFLPDSGQISPGEDYTELDGRISRYEVFHQVGVQLPQCVITVRYCQIFPYFYHIGVRKAVVSVFLAYVVLQSHMEKKCSVNLLHFRDFVYSKVKSSNWSFELSMSRGIYLITIWLVKYLFLIPIAWFFCEGYRGRPREIYLYFFR